MYADGSDSITTSFLPIEILFMKYRTFLPFTLLLLLNLSACNQQDPVEESSGRGVSAESANTDQSKPAEAPMLTDRSGA